MYNTAGLSSCQKINLIMILNLFDHFYESHRGKKLSDGADDSRKYQNYYCLDSKGQIAQPPKSIQPYIRNISGKSCGFSKYEAIDIGLNLRRHIVSQDEGLLMAIRDEWALPNRCYDFFTVEEVDDDDYCS